MSWIEDPKAQVIDTFSVNCGEINVCIPSFQLDPEMSAKCDRRQRSNSAGGSSMEIQIQTMVSNIIGPFYRSAMSTASGSLLSSSSLGESTTHSSQSPQIQAGRVACGLYQAISALAEYTRKGVQNSIGFMEKKDRETV